MFSFHLLYFVKAWVSCMRKHTSPSSVTSCSCMYSALSGGGSHFRQRPTQPSALSLWRALRMVRMDLHVSDNSLLSHSTCFLSTCRVYAFNIPQIRNAHLFKVFNARYCWLFLVDFFPPPKNKDTSSETWQFQSHCVSVCVSVCVPFCPSSSLDACWGLPCPVARLCLSSRSLRPDNSSVQTDF